jgi:hypothetical protein
MEHYNELGAVGLRAFTGYADRANNTLVDSLPLARKLADTSSFNYQIMNDIAWN